MLIFENNTIFGQKRWIFRLDIFDPSGIGTNYFSLFVSYTFKSNKTQLTEFPESKSDMPLFHWVLALK